ncbi:TlpA family protein disulfide reductase [bacterium]|nr:TlpA family protein disulfide reductase [bacterium]
MRLKTITRIFLPLLLLTILTPFLFAANNDHLLIGQEAPIITGKKAVGKGLLSLTKLMSDLGYKKDKNGKFVEKNGKYVFEMVRNVVVLNFFSTTCIPCMQEIPTYNRLAEKYKDQPVNMIYVNIDPDSDPLDMQLFIARKQIKVPMMLPNQKDAIKKYDAYRLPRMVIINKDRKIEHIINGFNENLETEISTIVDRLLQ